MIKQNEIKAVIKTLNHDYKIEVNSYNLKPRDLYSINKHMQELVTFKPDSIIKVTAPDGEVKIYKGQVPEAITYIVKPDMGVRAWKVLNSLPISELVEKLNYTRQNIYRLIGSSSNFNTFWRSQLSIKYLKTLNDLYYQRGLGEGEEERRLLLGQLKSSFKWIDNKKIELIKEKTSVAATSKNYTLDVLAKFYNDLFETDWNIGKEKYNLDDPVEEARIAKNVDRFRDIFRLFYRGNTLIILLFNYAKTFNTINTESLRKELLSCGIDVNYEIDSLAWWKKNKKRNKYVRIVISRGRYTREVLKI